MSQTKTQLVDGFNINTSVPADSFVIDSSGRLLVGTSSAPSNKNSVTPTVVVSASGVSGAAQITRHTTVGGGGALLELSSTRGTSNTDYTILQSGDGIGTVDFLGADGNEFVVAASIQAQVDGTPGDDDMPGRLVFSTTADGGSSPTERLWIGNAGTSDFYSTGNRVLSLASSSTAGTTNYLFYGTYGATSITSGTTSFLVFTNGNVQNTNNSYGAISDVKLKENIVDASSQWDDIKALQIRKYNFIEGQTHTQIGVVAQEVETVSPGLVIESPDRDEEGNDLGTTTKSVNYSVLYMKAVKALQEAMERIEALEAKVAALEGQ